MRYFGPAILVVLLVGQIPYFVASLKSGYLYPSSLLFIPFEIVLAIAVSVVGFRNLKSSKQILIILLVVLAIDLAITTQMPFHFSNPFSDVYSVKVVPASIETIRFQNRSLNSLIITLAAAAIFLLFGYKQNNA